MKHVAIIVETALASGRNILNGVSRYVHERDDWSVFHPTGYMGSMKSVGIEEWDGDGIIVRLATQETLEIIRAKGLPVVDVLGNLDNSPYPLVKCDDRAIGQMVANHFLRSGHRHFGFLGLSDERWSLERQVAYIETVRERAESASVSHFFTPDDQTERWDSRLSQVTHWIQSLPRPLALMVASDQFGPIAIKACQRLGLSVPEEVSVVGVDNDPPFCDLCQPRLSSVEPDHARVGYEAAQLLDRLMSGNADSMRQIETPPLTLHRRPSSDATAVSDPALVKALQAVREGACLGISVDEIAATAALSRSVLQRRFKEQLGRTVGEAILTTKLRRARDMLTFTSLPLAEVAERSGFNYQEYLSAVFKKHLGTTPAQYRNATKSLQND